jgi:two-component SAPR family response regulator
LGYNRAREISAQYISAAETLINLYIKTGKYTQAVALSNRALEEDYIQRRFARSAMMAYSALDDARLCQQFEKCRSVLMNELQSNLPTDSKYL